MTEIQKNIFIFICIGISLNGFSQNISFANRDGFFSIGTQSNRTASITLVDIDKDGDLDALVANGRHWAEQNYLYYNDGRGGFKLAQPIGNFLEASYSIKSADFNNDGFMDIAVANDNIDNKIYFGNAEYNYSNGVKFGVKSPTRNMEIGDIDNDGDIDIILSNRSAKNEIYLNNGKGNFDNSLTFGDSSDKTIETKMIDINGDGNLDLVSAERNISNKIYINDGKLNFSKVIEFGKADDETRSIAIGDLNNDGYLDIVCGNLNSENNIFYGNKKRNFKKYFSFKANRETSSIQVSDLNNDGYLDII